MKLPKIYEPALYESDIYALWDKSHVFKANATSNKPHFSISMPPPNETGTLSLGHALFLTLQDIMARYQRLQGKDVLWLPGTDHAALPVNAIIEKRLTEQGTTKHEIGREEFLRRTVEFVGESRSTMLGQMRAMGASADWSRLRYTLDDSLSRCVREVFTKMYNDGLIYRGNRIVNWDPNLETTVSDDEVVYKEEKATLYTFKYGPFHITTARPETKFGDKYVVMHPDDKRYVTYKHGDTFEADWINGTVTATVIKDAAVDPAFGTGVMTITPWHDVTDFEIAERHKLDKEQVIDFHGTLLPIAQEYSGMPIAEARLKIVEKLRSKGLVVSENHDYMHNVAINDRGKGVIEPQIKLQWFVDVNKEVVDWKGKQRSLKQVMQSVVLDGDIDILPSRFEKIYFHWIDNLRDWCISRQIWWGHRIPVWYRTDSGGKLETYVGVEPPTEPGKGQDKWEQDPDTLDTWFSSALWTWSTLIDPDLARDPSVSFEDLLKQSPDFKAYHSTSVMETGWDILFFWVARMILATTYATKQIPFKTVYLHGMVRAEDGKKMSKSRPESIIDPLDVIAKYGTDALRMALIMGVSPGNDQNWGWGKIEANRNFCNKLWNIARYVKDVVGDTYKRASAPEPKTPADHWMLSKLQHSTETIATHLDAYRFSEAYDVLYHFVWDDFADWYIEASKTGNSTNVLAYGLESILKIAHPFAPFVTETIWQTLKWENDSLLARARWPQILAYDKKQAKTFEDIKAIVTEVRFITRALQAQGSSLHYTEVPFLTVNAESIKRLARLADVSEVATGSGVYLTESKYRCWLDIDEATAISYQKQLQAKQTAQEAVVKQLQGRLKNKSYVDHAPKHVVEQTREQLAAAQEMLESLDAESKRYNVSEG